VAVVQYTFTYKRYIEQHNNFGRVRAVAHPCGYYPGICLTTEEKARKTLSLVKAFSRHYCKTVTVVLSIIPLAALSFIFYMKNMGSAWFAWNFKQFKYDFRS
jgi:hypothetical protein